MILVGAAALLLLAIAWRRRAVVPGAAAAGALGWQFAAASTLVPAIALVTIGAVLLVLGEVVERALDG